MSDNPTPPAAAPQAPTTTPTPAAGGDPQPQTATEWQAKFEAQQKVNRDLEGKFNALRDQQATQTQALAKALGIAPNEPTPDVAVLAATVETLASQFTATQHENQALAIAAQHGITTQSDIDTLKAIKDPATMQAVAARFAAAAGAPTGRPAPDLTQGAQGTPAAGTPEQDFASFLGRQLG